jgi:hypothetical protein
LATRCSTGNSIFRATGWKIALAAKKLVFLRPSAFRRSVSWEDAMMERVHQAQIPVAWVVADTVYGTNLDLRTWLEDHQYWFALAVASTEQIGMMTPEGRTRLPVAQAEQRFVNEQEWQRFSVKTGTKGPLLFEWACLPILHRRARRRATLVAHSSYPNASHRQDLLPGLRPCWHRAFGDGLGGGKQMVY